MVPLTISSYSCRALAATVPRLWNSSGPAAQSRHHLQSL